ATTKLPSNRDAIAEAPRDFAWDTRFKVEALLAAPDKKGSSNVRVSEYAGEHILGKEERREIAGAMASHPMAGHVRGLHSLFLYNADGPDPIIPHLLWVAYEPILAAEPKKELGWTKEYAQYRVISDTIAPRAMRRLIATGKREDVGLCVEFIGDLADSGVRAKALDALVSAIGNRTVDAPGEWDTVHAKLTKDDHADVKRLTNSLAVKFKDAEAIRRAMAVAGDASKSTDERLAALRDLAVVRSPGSAPFLMQLIRGQNDTQLKAEAIRALGGIDVPKIAADLLGEWAQLTPGERNEVVQVLAGRK